MVYNPLDPDDTLDVAVIDINGAFDQVARWFQGSSAPSSPSSYQSWAQPSTDRVHFRDETNTTWVPWLLAAIPSGHIFSDGTDHITIKAPADVGSGGYTLVLPGAQGANNQYLKNDGAGNLVWTTLAGGVTALNDLSDVTITSSAAGDYLRHNGTVYVDHAGVLVGDLTVASQANGDLIARLSGAWTRLAVGTNGQVLTVVSGAPAWAAGGGGATNLDGLTDVVITSAASGDYLRHNGTNWVDHAGVLVGDLTVASAAQGDLIYRGASVFQRLAIGTSGQVLTVAGGVPTWAAPSGGGAVELDDLTDVVIGAPATGEYLRFAGSSWVDSQLLLTDLFVSSQATGDLGYFNGTTWTRLPRGTNGQFLRATSSDVAWQTVTLGATDLDGLSDVVISSPASGHSLRHNGSAFVNARIQVIDFETSGTVAGDIITRGASAWGRLAVGSNNQVLTVVSGAPAWANASAGALNDLTDVDTTGAAEGSYLRRGSTQWEDINGVEIPDLFITSEARGDLVYRGSSGFTRLPLGANGKVLTSDGTDAVWADPTGGGGGGNSFTTINCPSGTDPVADSATDTLNLLAGTGISITGNSTNDEVTWAVVPGAVDHDALLNFVANEHNDRTATVSITGAWSFDRTSASEQITDFTNPGTSVHSVRVDGDFIIAVGGNLGRIKAAAISASRNWTFPDLAGEVTVLGNSVTGTNSIVRNVAPAISAPVLTGNVDIDSSGVLRFLASGGNFVFDCPSTLGQTTTVTLKDPGVSATNLITSHWAEFDADILLKDDLDLTFKEGSFSAKITLAGVTLTANRVFTLPDVADGEITIGGNAFTGTGSLVRANAPTFSGTASFTALTASAIQAQSMLLKELTGADTLELRCTATAASYTLNFPSSADLPVSGTRYLKVDSSGNISYSAS